MADETLRTEEVQRALARAQAKLTPTASRVRSLRRRYGDTQEQFAQRAGVTVSTMNRWENGLALPSPLALQVLAKLTTLAPGNPSG